MWIPLLAFLTAGIVSLQKCQRGPGPVLRAARVLAAVPGLCQRPENRCATSNAVTCKMCLALGPECGWCTQEDFMAEATQKGRCDMVFNLIKKGCQSEFIENPTSRVTVPSDHKANTQVTPGQVSIQLRPGGEASFVLKVHPLEKYPVDLYYLVDVSASMHNNIEKLNSVGFDLSKKMANISLDFRLGFGSYVDKTVSPYISIHPERIHNQCSDYNLDCMPPHGYIHVLSLTDNIAEFKNAVNKQKISGNIDTPEGGFDAMLQAAVCQSHIGWRKEAKRLLLVMTDQTSHLALDSKLAGIVIPNDGNCHLKDNVYIKATSMEHPSLGQLSEKLIDNNINVIFAVQGNQFHWYKDLLPLLPGTVARQIESQAANLNDLVVEAYQKLISEVKIQVDNQIQDLHFNITAICPDGSKRAGMEGCKNVAYNDEVLFNVSVAMKGCGTSGRRKYVVIKPIGFNETTIINIHKNCACHCEDSTKHSRICADETFLDDESTHCEDTNCSSSEDMFSSERCKLHPDQPICSGQGDCIGGKCLCHRTKLGKVYGRYCEMDDFSCPYYHGNLCAGNGECETGKCRCFRGWEGDRCQCSSLSAKHCMNSKGQICSGRGACVCGKCECTDPRSFGRLCEYCPSCNNVCDDNRNCVQCHHSDNASQTTRDQCKASCAYMVHYIDPTFECFSDPSYFRIFFIIFIVTFLIGLLNVLIIRQIILQWNSNKVKSSSDYRASATKKDKMFLPTVCSRTVTYRRDKPEEINIEISKLRLNETFKCEF
ncbi:integrin beta-8 isoform X2 [Pelodiscus sinensis]|uniref:Integrin beta n=1 Tax=Pelodiscus sinensis TaxID=13735 RepID=K7FB23_PELSI|nr:integrin beta-8 isoform X2 [Pelodiscus sinensis]|eukprot:XP_006138404.1 integrin beta-8 isoform X2 [Pelodiscus sinensis]